MTSRGRSSHRHREAASADGGSDVAVTDYTDYPIRRPFVNVTDDTRPPVGRAVNTAPESSRDAIASALMNLQQKIRNLEKDRRSAEDSARSLAAETSRYGDIVRTLPPAAGAGLGLGEERGADRRSRGGQQYPEPSVSSSSPLSRQPPPADADMSRTSNGFDRSGFGGVDDVHGKLDRAHDRCRQLEHELANMQQLLRDAERVTRVGASVAPPSSSAVAMGTGMSPPTRQSAPYVNGTSRDTGASQDQIDRLEREHLKLTASQTVAESKLRELEVQVMKEKLLRKIQQQRQDEDEEEGEVPIDFIEEDRPVKLKKKKNKKKSPVPKAANGNFATATRGPLKTSTGSSFAASKGRRDPGGHYRLKLADIPFISGKSTAQSHSLPANFQEVLSLMKNHNTRLCHNPHQHLQHELRQLHKAQSTASTARQRSKSRERSSPDDLSDLLQQLQDEFGQLSLEHDELIEQLRDTSDDRLRDALEADLDRIISRMEAKGHQIMRLKGHREELHGHRNVIMTEAERPHSAGARLVPDDGMVEVTTTVKTKGKGAGAIVMPTTNRALASLSLYKDIKKIQTTLRKDDITWDC